MNKTLSFKNLLKSIANSIMLPIALLPIAGLFIGIGEFFCNPQIINYLNLSNLSVLSSIVKALKYIGDIIFSSLPLIFAACIAGNLAEKEKCSAIISSIVSFLAMHQTISSLLSINGKLEPGALHEGSLSEVCGIESLNMGIFSGIIVGIGVAYVHNRLLKTKFNEIFSFFEGTKLVLITSFFMYVFIGAIIYFIWPIFQNAVYSLIRLVNASKYAGTLVYGLTERILKPFGLNSVFTTPFFQTAVGGRAIIDGSYLTGVKDIFFAELSSSTATKFSVEISKFMSGNFPFKIFGLPAGAFAIYSTLENSKRKQAFGILIFTSIVCMLVGISEPLEYIFLFSAPLLYGMHCILAGISFMLMHLLKVTVGIGFSGGLIDLLYFGFLQGNEKTNWIYIIPVGITYALIYYFLFRFMIRKFKLTPFIYRKEDLK